ncbi:UNVERIFIED_CONTAM: Fatty acid amide hydrolase [Sesamum radiatum]|uniref:Fatty acid amide hydrolase n=1 Tax=Sesamum radiatum TaxID=300843 RepID=A0AAW2MWD0_SESRA
MLRNTVIPEAPMFKPEFPPQESEPEVVLLDEDGKPEERVELALKTLPDYDPANSWIPDSSSPFRYWKIRDYAFAYRSKLTTPSAVAERFISALDEFNSKKPPTPLLISYDPELIRRQAAASTQRFEEGNPLSVLDGIFVAIKDDIDCYPHPSKGGTTFFHEVRPVEEDAVSVARLRRCGVILVGKANMHELGLGTTGNNPNHGTARNPHAPERYTGGSSSGPAAIVASGLCSAALGTDGGGSVRIPSSLCGVVGLKSTYGRTDMSGKRVKFTHDTRTNLALFRSFSASDYVAAQCLRRRLMHYHMEIFKKVDVIITPTTGMTAPVIPPASLSSGETNLQVSGNLMRFVVNANLLGFPAISVPVGYDKQGLPIGLQIIGRPWCEATILRLAAAIEELCATPKKKPLQFHDILKGN